MAYRPTELPTYRRAVARAAAPYRRDFDDRARPSMHDALHEHFHVGILETLDSRAAAVTMRKQSMRIAGDLLDERIAMTAEEWHERVR